MPYFSLDLDFRTKKMFIISAFHLYPQSTVIEHSISHWNILVEFVLLIQFCRDGRMDWMVLSWTETKNFNGNVYPNSLFWHPFYTKCIFLLCWWEQQDEPLDLFYHCLDLFLCMAMFLFCIYIKWPLFYTGCIFLQCLSVIHIVHQWSA